MWRSFTALAVAVVAGMALHRLVVVPWRCNLVERRVSSSTEKAWSLRGSPEAHEAAARNIALLGECPTLCRTNVSLSMMEATNFRLLNRESVAASLLEKALQYERRPELYFDLAMTQLELGSREAALQNFIRAGSFAGTADFDQIPDPRDPLTSRRRDRSSSERAPRSTATMTRQRP
jgi:hypothetical protein